ncbi:MAG: hypothetical protein CXR30_04965 [Geobacter sp.]|nr:MAG: hypothetical protein CXR30_04965 [Geobacter sp.]
MGPEFKDKKGCAVMNRAAFLFTAKNHYLCRRKILRPRASRNRCMVMVRNRAVRARDLISPRIKAAP